MNKIFTTRISIILCVFLYAFVPQSLQSQTLLLEENFNYIEASTLVSNGWSQISTVATPTVNIAGAGLTYTGYAGSGMGDAALVGNVGQDVYKSLTAVTAGSIYLAAMVNVSEAGSGDFFLSFFYNNTWRGRLYVKSDGAGGFFFGVGKSTTPSSFETTKRSFGTTYLVVLKYTIVANASNDLVSLFVNPALSSTEPLPTIGPFTDTGTDLAQISGISFRQGGGAGVAPSASVGGIRVHTNWETIFPAPPSMNSDIISAGNETSNINYAAFQSSLISTVNEGVKLWSFTIRDGGGIADADAKPTIIKNLIIKQGSGNQVSDWAADIRQATLFEGSTKIADAISISNNSITFSNLPETIDDASKTLDLYLTFKNSVTDNQQFQFKISKTDVSLSNSTNSQLSDFSDAVSSISGDANRIEVIANQLVFVQQPIDVAPSVFISPAVTLEAIDIFKNRDLDFNSKIDITANGATLSNSPVSVLATNGLVSFPNLIFSTTGTDVKLTAQKNEGGWSLVSNSFVVTSSPLISFSSISDFGIQIRNTNSLEKKYSISGTGLSENLIISPSANFQISLTSGTGFISFPNTLNINQINGAIPSTTIYVRFAPSAADGSTNEVIKHTSGSLSRDMAVSGISVAAEPSLQSAISFEQLTKNSVIVKMNGGNGQGRIVVAKAESDVNFVPADISQINGLISGDFSLAADIENGNKIVYEGSGTSVLVTGLQNATKYSFAVYEYNQGTNNSRNYLTSAPTLASVITGNRYETEIFTDYKLTSDIPYGQSVKASGTVQDLLLDIYEPKGDQLQKRPLIIFIHGGGFKGNTKVGSFSTMYCGNLAKCGYLVTSIEYRLSSTIANDKEHFEAMIRAVQDAKAAVRFFRKNANLYKVDTSMIYVTGSSAGSITALHLAYLNSEEIPTTISSLPFSMAALGTLEGTSGNPDYSSKIHGVISNWGALADFRWMKKGDVPVYTVHGTADVTVPMDSSFSDGPFKYGSTIITESAMKLGIPSGIQLFAGTGHTLDNNMTKQIEAYRKIASWLYTTLKIRTSPQLIADNINNNGLHDMEIHFADDPIWRDSITWIKVDGKTLDPNTDFQISQDKIILKPSGGNPLLKTQGVKLLQIEARGFQDAKVNQLITLETGIKKKENIDLQVYTYQKNLVIKNQELSFHRIELYNLLGKIVKSYPINQTEQSLNVGNLVGIYLVRVYSDNEVFTKKVFFE